MKRFFKKEFTIGICVIVALVILFFGVEYLKGVSVLHSANYYYVVYNNVSGLDVSAPVKVNGFKVGTVDNISLKYDDPSKIVATISLDKKLRLPKGSKAMIATDLLGTASIQLQLAESQKNYSPGDTIPAGMVAGLMDAVSKDVMPSVAEIMPKVDSIMTNIDRITSSPALMSSLQNLEKATASLGETMRGVNASVSKLPGIMSEADRILLSVDSIADNLLSLSGTLANAPIDSIVGNLNTMSEQLAQITRQINDPESNLGKFLYGTELYDNLTRATADIDSLLVDIKKNPKRYISIKLL